MGTYDWTTDDCTGISDGNKTLHLIKTPPVESVCDAEYDLALALPSRFKDNEYTALYASRHGAILTLKATVL